MSSKVAVSAEPQPTDHEIIPDNALAAETVGHVTTTIKVELSTRFLQHFSEQLYSSPQKAFEELISNGWDAGADAVEVVVPDDLTAPHTTLSVLDNGTSMDEEGLRQLWHIAFSPKVSTPFANGRAVIGKFGIGKLATYVLANKLTYICRASDGKIRRVTMDFGTVDKNADPTQERLISDLELSVFELTEEELDAALHSVVDGDRLAELISNGIPKPTNDASVDEFRTPPDSFKKPASTTWTLTILSDLKPAGRELKLGVLRRALRAALPFGTEMAISVNGSVLQSTKVDVPVKQTWVIGPELGIKHVEIAIPAASPEDDADSSDDEESAKEAIVLDVSGSPYPHVNIPGIGTVTGTVYLFEDKVSGGKSEGIAASNGFHINVLGRVVNIADSTFGERNLSHSAWSKFRMAVRADGLNAFLTTDREKFRDCREMSIFRAFLRRAFNKVRTEYDSDANASLPDGGDVLVRSLGVVSLASLRNVVSEALTSEIKAPMLFDDRGLTDRKTRLEAWKSNTSDDIGNAVKEVKYEKAEDDVLVKFRLADNTIVVNSQHPFALEHSKSRAEKELVRTIGMVNLLSDVYALDAGVDSKTLMDVMSYRDRLMRFRSLQRRKSGTYIAKLLLQMQTESSNSKLLEAVLSDALRYLGFDVEDLAQSGEPEGVARAYPLPTRSNPSTKDEIAPPLYSFTFDAKSSTHPSATTGNLNLDGIVEHRKKHQTTYSLVVAPGFQKGAVTERCTALNITPICARDLGKLLEYTAECGAIPLDTLEKLFKLHDPAEVSNWVDSLKDWAAEHRPLTMDIFMRALESLHGQVPDVVAASTIAFVCRTTLKAYSVKEADVLAIAKGLAILIPDLVGVDGDKIVVNASARRVTEAVKAQLERLHEELPSGNNE